MTSHILIVEDNPDNAALLMKILEPYDYKISHAKDAMTGFWIAQLEPLDLVLLDMGLPDMHGSTLAKCLQTLALSKEVPIVVVTADTTDRTRQHALAAGCKAIIYKPIDTHRFPEQVAQYLGVSNT